MRTAKTAAKTDAQLGATFTEAMRLWDRQKADGVSEADRIAGLERTLRAAWPFTRAWRYLCETCRDVGVVISTCDGSRDCGCLKRFRTHLPHEYGTPCHCSLGARFKAMPAREDDFAEAGKTRKPTRVGR